MNLNKGHRQGFFFFFFNRTLGTSALKNVPSEWFMTRYLAAKCSLSGYGENRLYTVNDDAKLEFPLN